MRVWVSKTSFAPVGMTKKAHEDLADNRQAPDYIHTCRATAPEMSTAGFQVQNTSRQAC